MTLSTINRKLFIFTTILLLYGISCVAALTPEELATLALDSTVVVRTESPEGTIYGSGFVIGEGVIATNYHLIETEGQSVVTVKLVRETTTHWIQSIPAVDVENDLAIIIAEGVNAPILPLGDSDAVQVGEEIYVAGNPYGLEGTFSDGLISAIRQDKESGKKLFQMTAPVSPGSSGGPVLNGSGEVIGITVGLVSQRKVKDPQNLNFAVPVNYLKTLAGTIVNNPPPTARFDAPPIYWTSFTWNSDTQQYTNSKIQRVKSGSTNVEDLVTTGLGTPASIALDVDGGKMYWTNFGMDKIQRANLDGSNVQDLVTIGLARPAGIALDVDGGKMYWTDFFTAKIQCANLDGTNIQDLVTTGLFVPYGIALDVAGGKMYWTDNGTDKIQRANLDGSNVQDLVTQGLGWPAGIALDVDGGKMYWTDRDTDKIQRANLDGSNVQDLVTTGLRYPSGIALDVAGGEMYWADSLTEKIQRANLDGSNVQDVVTGITYPNFIALSIPSPSQQAARPDLVVEGIRAYPETLDPGEEFGLYATLKNSGTTTATATTVRYYHSIDSTIFTDDTQLRTGNRDSLAVDGTIRLSLTVAAPTIPGTYYYGVCVDSIPNESDTNNNCSRVVSVIVTAPPIIDLIAPDAPPIYWTDSGTDKIQRANLDGSNVQDLVIREHGLSWPQGIALDVAEGKMYWTDSGTDKIQRANLDGSNVQDLVIREHGLSWPQGIALDVAEGKMYWTDSGTDKIQRANLDGSNVQDLVTRGLRYPSGIALDVAEGKMYWTDSITEKIQRANLDGSNVQDLVTTGLARPQSIALDVDGGKMYWTDWLTDKIQCANLDGSNVQDLITTGLGDPEGIALDVAEGKMYWTDSITEKIQRANLDGTNVQDVVPGLKDPFFIALGIPPQQTTKPIREDVNGDGVVDVKDLVFVAQRYGQTGENPADVNGDKIVNIYDIVFVAAVIDAAAAAPSLQAQVRSMFTAEQLQQWLIEAKVLRNASVTYQRGIQVLEQLLAALLPKETALLANYPNPFNPETWIPYQLAAAADVSIDIYAADGKLVRSLALGHQPIGIYQSKSRAAHWDGRNTAGERVASGVYFYQLTTPSFQQTRRLVILK